jgi:hypothetical protein
MDLVEYLKGAPPTPRFVELENLPTTVTVKWKKQFVLFFSPHRRTLVPHPTIMQ